jgi:hypothetical protein
MTRRELAAVLGSVTSLATVRAQDAPANQPEDLNAAAKEQLHKNSETLSKFDLPMSTEPAFLFKA